VSYQSDLPGEVGMNEGDWPNTGGFCVQKPLHRAQTREKADREAGGSQADSKKAGWEKTLNLNFPKRR